MSKMLKPLLLPQLVEERRKRESSDNLTINNDLERAISTYPVGGSPPSSPATPSSPTFSMRGHLRYSSSTSSLDASLQLPPVEPPASPTLTIIKLKASKRSLPDVLEEPHDEHDEQDDFDMLTKDELYDCLCDRDCIHRNTDAVQSSLQLPITSPHEYDLNDGFFSDGDVEPSHRPKKRRDGESQFSFMAARLGSRFPSFSRKWRARREISPISSPVMTTSSPVFQTRTSRSSSLSIPEYQMDGSYGMQSPPTPAISTFEEAMTTYPLSIDIEAAQGDVPDREEHLASTPLLPPLMTDAAANNQQAVQSPLQSPSVADSNDPFARSVLSINKIATPVLPGTPSPPLSAKPSTSSFHHVSLARLMPTSEIPPMLIADEDDEWSIKLGHANFVVAPEPYIPATFDIEACRQLRADWDLARTNYTKHLVRTGEHYGVTSNTYSLTEEKWAQTDAIWKRNNDLTIQNTVDSDGDAFSTLKHTTFGGDANNVMTRIPSLNDPKGQGKFPELGDQEIVGPMVQVAGQLQRMPSKKTKIMRFLVDKFPGAALGRP